MRKNKQTTTRHLRETRRHDDALAVDPRHAVVGNAGHDQLARRRIDDGRRRRRVAARARAPSFRSAPEAGSRLSGTLGLTCQTDKRPARPTKRPADRRIGATRRCKTSFRLCARGARSLVDFAFAVARFDGANLEEQHDKVHDEKLHDAERRPRRLRREPDARFGWRRGARARRKRSLTCVTMYLAPSTPA